MYYRKIISTFDNAATKTATKMTIIDYIMILPDQLTITGCMGERSLKLSTFNRWEKWLDVSVSRKFLTSSLEFNWGYSGSGPTQSSFAILLEFLPYHLVWDYYIEFKYQVIASFPQRDFEITINLKKIIYEMHTKSLFEKSKTQQS